jgi:hypothetical protein
VNSSFRVVAVGSNMASRSHMPRVTNGIWTPEQLEILRVLLKKGASPWRASVVLKRPRLAVQDKARQLGTPFPDVRQVRAARLAKERA